MKFRRKPEPVDAVQYVETSRSKGPYIDLVHRNGNEVAAFMDAELVQELTVPADARTSATTLVIGVGGKNYTLPVGYWVVKDSAGKFHACNPDKFLEMFEPADPTS